MERATLLIDYRRFAGATRGALADWLAFLETPLGMAEALGLLWDELQ